MNARYEPAILVDSLHQPQVGLAGVTTAAIVSAVVAAGPAIAKGVTIAQAVGPKVADAIRARAAAKGMEPDEYVRELLGKVKQGAGNGAGKLRDLVQRGREHVSDADAVQRVREGIQERVQRAGQRRGSRSNAESERQARGLSSLPALPEKLLARLQASPLAARLGELAARTVRVVIPPPNSDPKALLPPPVLVEVDAEQVPTLAGVRRSCCAKCAARS